MGDPEWARDEKFADGYSRWQNHEELDRHIEEWTMHHTREEVTELLQKAGVAAFTCMSNKDLVEDAHLAQRGFFQEWDHPEIGSRKYDGLLSKMSKTPGRIERRAPLLGEHNEFVFCALLGLSRDEFDNLVAEKILF